MPKKDVEADQVPPSKRVRLKRWLIGFAGVCGALMLLGAISTGVAEHHTSQPQFCGSCHVMEPYFETWQADIHGTKLGVACVECHYAPGEQTTIKAKFRGLSQAASYFSGRYGKTRPRAYVSNTSCMTAKCHGDMRFMDKPIVLGTVKFTHAKHLQRSDDQEKPAEERLAELQKTLTALIGDDHFAELQAVAVESGPGDERYDKLVSLCNKWSMQVERGVLVEFSQLHHRKVRIAQLLDLQCTNCHAYHSPTVGSTDVHRGRHFQVSTSTCFTCHFNNEGFNTGTNTCLKCHTPPQQEITVHSELRTNEQLQSPELATKLVKMNHADILAKKVDCIACHADAARQDSTVTRRDCERCHDQPRFFADWKEPFTLAQVTDYHRLHIREQRAKCLDCHSEIKHSLVHGAKGPDTEFLTSALADCTHCHPKHHAEQVNLLLGRGGVGVEKGDPNLMFGSRTNCSGCHIELASDGHGDGVIKATEKSCITCHGERHADTFEKWKAGLALTLADAEEAYQNTRQMLDEKSDAPADNRTKATALLAAAERDLQLVKHGNGLHNVTYAIELLDSVTSRCREAMSLLSKP